MRLVRIAIALLLTSPLNWAKAVEPMPPGVSVRITMAGPAFVDAEGMTLYQRAGDSKDYCSGKPETVRPFEAVFWNGVREVPMRVPDPESRRSCAEKYPPFITPADAKPIGHWTIQVREDGVRQWAYKGTPLHGSAKDRNPGDISNAETLELLGYAWRIAEAPIGAPVGIKTGLTWYGLAFTDHEGRALYYPAANSAVSFSQAWRPLLAPILATAEHYAADWSIVETRGGLRQWAWKRNPLYVYAGDVKDGLSLYSGRQLVKSFGHYDGKPISGWRIALLKPASAPPSGVGATSFFYSSNVYADGRGRTLYTITCNEMTRDRVECDDVGDSPRYWLSFCGGEERCMKTWRPFIAHSDAQPIDGLWSTSVMNPRHPYKPLPKGETGLRVWTYAGRFVFTYAGDQTPGDVWGATGPGRQVMRAWPIIAFGPTLDQ